MGISLFLGLERVRSRPAFLSHFQQTVNQCYEVVLLQDAISFFKIGDEDALRKGSFF